MKIDEVDFLERYKTGNKKGFMGMIYDEKRQRYIRVRRIIHSPFWNFIHNLIAHPLIAIYRPWGERLHNWTAEKMYAGPQDTTPDDSLEITAVMD
jgi:hypothetical protein